MAANPVEVALIIVKTALELQDQIDSWKRDNQTIGFVPTMGALHNGHLHLIHEASKDCTRIVCSIFVNPTQFNDPADFERYPRNWDSDIEKLRTTTCSLLFIPEVNEVYTNEVDQSKKYEFGEVANVMEGSFRPGHFNGVAMVVKRLFELVKPHKAYFGKKDFQQYTIIKKLVEQEKMSIEIIGIDTVREKDGLAMSSRNTLLTPENREMATVIYDCLIFMKEQFGKIPVANLKLLAEQRLSGVPDVRIEYIEIASEDSLQPVNENYKGKARAFIAAFFGKIRLIDNLELN